MLLLLLLLLLSTLLRRPQLKTSQSISSRSRGRSVLLLCGVVCCVA
jgi:hypothetical protein